MLKDWSQRSGDREGISSVNKLRKPFHVQSTHCVSACLMVTRLRGLKPLGRRGALGEWVQGGPQGKRAVRTEGSHVKVPAEIPEKGKSRTTKALRCGHPEAPGIYRSATSSYLCV